MRFDSLMVRVLSAACGLMSPASPVPAQEWHMGVQAGRIRSVLDPARASETLALGLRYDDPAAGLRVLGGLPRTSAEPLWGGVGGWRRMSLPAGRLRAGIDVSANLFATFDRTTDHGPLPGPFDPPVAPVDRSGHAAAGQVLPLLGLEWDRAQVHARAGVSRYAARFGAERADRTVRLADVQMTLLASSRVAVMPVYRRFVAAGERAAAYTGASAVVTLPAASAWAGVGRWFGGSGQRTPWSAGARLHLHPQIALDAAARHDTFDPLYLQPAQRSWSVGLSVRLGGPRPAVRPPVPSSHEDGEATIRLPVSRSAEAPSIAGDFNAWTPAAMRREGGDWTYRVAVPPGVYHYAFVTPDGRWFVPEGVAGRKDDGMGGHVAVLVVR